MTPFDDFVYLINHVLLGEEPTIEDFILLVGTLVAFIAFILWCCFPIQPKEPGQHRQFTCKIIQNHIKAFDAAASTNDNDNGTAATATASNCGSNSSSNNIGSSSNTNSGNNIAAAANSGNLANNNGNNGNNLSNNSNNSQYNGGGGSYSKNGTVAMHNYYVKNGHHCCT